MLERWGAAEVVLLQIAQLRPEYRHPTIDIAALWHKVHAVQAYRRATEQAKQGDWAGVVATLLVVSDAVATKEIQRLLARAREEQKKTGKTDSPENSGMAEQQDDNRIPQFMTVSAPAAEMARPNRVSEEPDTQPQAVSDRQLHNKDFWIRWGKATLLGLVLAVILVIPVEPIAGIFLPYREDSDWPSMIAYILKGIVMVFTLSATQRFFLGPILRGRSGWWIGTAVAAAALIPTLATPLEKPDLVDNIAFLLLPIVSSFPIITWLRRPRDQPMK